MELFNRRYLCIIAFSFALTALLCNLFSGAVKLTLAVVFLILTVFFAFFFIKVRKNCFRMLFSVLLCLSIGLSALSSYLFVTLTEEKADSLKGENTVMVKIISKSGDGKYDVRLLRAGDSEVDIKAEVTNLQGEGFSYGDILIFKAEIGEAYDHLDRSKLLSLELDEEGEVYYNKSETKNYFSPDGIASLAHSMRDAFGEYVDGVFLSHGGIVKGLLVNDKSDIDEKTNLDFRRSGTLHILAVSGMHITLLMGALELLLRSLSVKKEIRIIIVSLFAVFFLALTAFVASAVRSVIMLFAVYLTYLFFEENDPITSLFVSIAIIILFSPFSVYDIGMWMSFLATLGILLVYPHFDAIMPYPNQKNKIVKYTLRFLVWCAKTLMLTVVANFFLLPIMWLFFGELSISTVPCNLILSPIVTVLMPLCAVASALGHIPYLGDALVFLTNNLADVMMSIVRAFSEMRYGVISLQYGFAGLLIAIFTVIFAVMLVIRIKRKLLIFVPMVAFTVAFATCFVVFSFTSKPTVEYVNFGSGEYAYLTKGAECSVVKLSENQRSNKASVLSYVPKYATEIDKFFLTSIDENDCKNIECLSKNTVIRTLYIPTTFENKDVENLSLVLMCAEKYNIKVREYSKENSVEIYNDVSFCYNADGSVSLSSSVASFNSSPLGISYSFENDAYFTKARDGLSLSLPLK